MSVFKRGTVWWYEFTKDGVRIQASSESRFKSDARDAEAKRRMELDEGKAPAKRRRTSFSDFASEWMESSRARWSNSNIDIQTYNLKHLNAHFGSVRLTNISAQDIGVYQAKRKDELAANRTINMEVATMRMILKSAKLWRAIEDDVHMLTEDKEIGKALTPDEESRLLDACGKSPQPSLLTAVVVFSNTGLRNSELRLAQWSQVDFLKKEFQVGKKAKTRASALRVIPLNQAALAALTAWRARWPDAKPEDYIFPTQKLVYRGAGSPERGQMTPYNVNSAKPLGSWKTAWGSAKEQAGVECRMHDLRHSLVSKLAETETPTAIIKAISGHTTAQMLALYSHISQEAKRQALAKLDVPPQTVQ